MWGKREKTELELKCLLLKGTTNDGEEDQDDRRRL